MDTDYSFIAAVALFFSIVFIVKVISDNKVRHKLIEKGMVDENLKFLYPAKKSLFHPLISVKWGFILIGIGLGFLLKQFFPETIDTNGVIGLIFIFSGIGFLSYYLIAKKELDKEEFRQE